MRLLFGNLNNWASFLSTSKGLFKEPKLKELEEMVEIIFQKENIIRELLLVY